MSNSSVLISLAIIGRLDLLRRKFGEVVVPGAVWREVVIEGMGKPGAKEVEQCSWIEVKEIKDKLLVRSLAQHRHRNFALISPQEAGTPPSASRHQEVVMRAVVKEGRPSRSA